MALNVALIPFSSGDVGGGFQQAAATISLLTQADMPHNFHVLSINQSNIRLLEAAGVQASSLGYRRLHQVTDALTHRSVIASRIDDKIIALFGRRIGRRLDRCLASRGIDLAYFLEPSIFASYLVSTNYITTVWDLCHLDALEFPEVHSTFAGREERHRYQLPKAVAVITNCESLSRRIISNYGVDPQRVLILPLLPALEVAGQATNPKNSLHTSAGRRAGQYIFYPANFWAHKNHLYVLEALVILRERMGISIDAVFCGRDAGNLPFLRERAERLGLADQVQFLGFVDNDDIPPLYADALALVMPTYFGPTNMPPIEAAMMDCPVVYSDFPAFREQMGHAALYCDLDDPASLAQILERLYRDPGVGEHLRAHGRRLICHDHKMRYVDALTDVLDRYEYKMRRWKK